MGNKGFAITGILYTLFILFTMILLSVLSALSYKKMILEKTISGLENTFIGEEKAIDNNVVSDGRTVLVAGKYEFLLRTNNDNVKEVKCVTYLKKGQIIPLTATTSGDVIFVPSDCNDYGYPISLDTSDNSSNKLVLKTVYEFKG